VFLSEGIAPPRWFQRAANKLHEVAQDFWSNAKLLARGILIVWWGAYFLRHGRILILCRSPFLSKVLELSRQRRNLCFSDFCGFGTWCKCQIFYFCDLQVLRMYILLWHRLRELRRILPFQIWEK
jgi:hypothetical protein